ncbi:uncharacterized protein LOC133330857, partial [Musca vetustissima]|uniref:uncharacterized protein LOC133330857 n=1 Tax=Musca vetustissima TaxID=27455 RepID=UPI002AB697AA
SLLPDINDQFVEKMGKFVLIMQTAKHLRRHQELQKIFQKAMKRNIVDIVVATYVGNMTFHWYSYDVFRPGQCRNTKPRRFNTFRKGLMQFEEIFPNKLRDFHQCPIEVAMRPAVPLFDKNGKKPRTYSDQYWGLQGDIMRMMAKKLNFRTTIHHINDSLTSEVYENGSSTGIFFELKEKRIDLIMGYYKYSTRARYFGSSVMYFLTPTVVVVSKKGRMDFLHGDWLLAPFGFRVWLFCIFVLVVKITVVQLLYHFSKSFKITWLDIFGLALGNSRNIQYRYKSIRLFVIIFTMAFIVINGSFQGKLFAAFHMKPNREPKSVPELIANNYTFLKNKFIAEDLIHALQIPTTQLKHVNYTHDFESYEQMLELKYPVAMLTNYWQYQAFLKSTRLYDEFEMLPDTVVVNQICAYMQPQSFLLEPFNRILSNLNYAGILKKWMLDSLGVFESSEQKKKSSKMEPIALTWDKLRLVFEMNEQSY